MIHEPINNETLWLATPVGIFALPLAPWVGGLGEDDCRVAKAFSGFSKISRLFNPRY
jgi:hypothetical protein